MNNPLGHSMTHDEAAAERAKLHDMLIIAEGQRDQAKMRAEAAEADARSAWIEYAGEKETSAQCLSYLRQSEDMRDTLYDECRALQTFVDVFGEWSSKYNAYNTVPMKDARADFETIMEAYKALMIQPSTYTRKDTSRKGNDERI